MVSKTVTVINEQGLHMRPAGILAKAVAAHKDCKRQDDCCKGSDAEYGSLYEEGLRSGNRL